MANYIGAPGKFRKKPVSIYAMHFVGDNHGYVTSWVGNDARVDGENIIIKTLEGDHTANPGDWIIRGVQGEFYPCKPNIFEATYEDVTDA